MWFSPLRLLLFMTPLAQEAASRPAEMFLFREGIWPAILRHADDEKNPARQQ
jgi:hypothetical protein